MFRTIVDKIQRDKDFPDRSFTIDVYSRVLDGAFYDHLPYGFHCEVNGANEYIKLRERRPSVENNICRIVVDDAISLLFSEGHFPTAHSDDDATKDALAQVIKGACLNEIMIDAATIGSTGSVAIHLRVLEQDKKKTYRLFVEPKCTEFLTPSFKLNAPDVLERVVEKYKVRGRELKARGYAIPDDELNIWWWFQRAWDDQAEIWYFPWKVGEEKPEKIEVEDKGNSVRHDLGFVPWVWVRNLPGKLKLIASDTSRPTYSDVDGACTFAGAVKIMIEIDYLLSQGGRGLKYTMDPLTLIKEPAAPNEEYVRSPANALVVSEKGDAKLLEMTGNAFEVVLEWAKALREIALENVHGNRAEAQKLSTAQSGRAMELMNQTLIWLADRLRISYGEGALRKILSMALKAHEKFPLVCDGVELPKVKADEEITLKWPRWYAPTYHDRQSMAGTLSTLTSAGLMSKETAVGVIAPDYDIADVKTELTQITKDADEESDRLVKEQAQIKASTSVTS